ncbi:PilW family protein [Uliginosibacterium gangwonense]|uniref:PilW family protein n=1 Tax=Uliginosibacterium gangwonense TaxID=392736 RepID=UPI00036137E4|nr:prepilin-type N-terminal cleavage/methylation domain-containing protein [Uliginosibacterium gangwonense]
MQYVPAKYSQGFTLVELMIAMVLGLIVVGGSVALFVSQRVTNRQSTEMVGIQAEGRIAMDSLARDVRAAGDFGCWPVGTYTQVINDGNRFYPDNGGIVGFARGTVSTAKLKGKDGQATVTMPAADIIATYTLDSQSDVVAIRGINGMLTELDSAMTDGTTALKLVTPAAGQDVKIGDALLITDCKASSIFEATSNSTTSVTHTAGTTTGIGTGNKQEGLGSIYKTGAIVGRLDVVWWFVATINNIKGLYRLSARDAILGNAKPQLVSDQVATLHLNYAYELAAEPTTGSSLATGEVKTVTADQLIANVNAGGLGGWFSVRGVTINMLIRSSKPGNTVAVPYTFDSDVQTMPTDRYVYLPMKMSVGIRNL